MSTVNQLVDDVGELVSLPEVYIKIQQLYADHDASMGDFERVVSTDPALCAKVLKIGNSAFFGFATKIDSVSRALMIMGTAQLHDLVLASSAISAFDGISNNLIDMKTFWRRSIQCGVLARLLGSQCNILDTDRLFLVGLLHDIGHLVMYSQLPEQAKQTLERSREEHRPAYLLEREIIGFDYAEVSCALMRNWSLADTIINPLENHLTPGRASLYELETSIIHIANSLAIKDELGEQAGTQVPPIVPVAWQTTGLTLEIVQAVESESRQHVEEAVSLFIPGPELKVA
ncbi:MAG: HDOD domain-containing protein [Gammaproteobacteria bacterium]|nr:HDOD domain-containing protein [Gammaproteobacteria bacterium]